MILGQPGALPTHTPSSIRGSRKTADVPDRTIEDPNGFLRSVLQCPGEELYVNQRARQSERHKFVGSDLAAVVGQLLPRPNRLRR